ncbi:MAG: UDP-glucose--hexose-1-phosphate uridylyltransferase [Solobacterium sp.]|nr:UDP-glucose--hexose-1-phosphate uridylyltransferase [Solobacterium sp.]
MNRRISQLLDHALKHGMTGEEDIDYSANQVLFLLQEESFERLDVPEAQLEEFLSGLAAFAVRKGIIRDTGKQREMFRTALMNCVMPRPSEVTRTFFSLYEEDPEKATDWFYGLAQASDYICRSKTDGYIRFTQPSPYGDLQITINTVKPEKDPEDILRPQKRIRAAYPKCPLCRENTGFAGTCRQTLRIIPLQLNGRSYDLQYSPYAYFNEHCIVLNHEHVPMKTGRETVENLTAFADLFPHYMIGSNAGLPVIGGSILSHDHYQGGRHHFPIEDASVLYSCTVRGFENVQTDILHWPLSAIRLTCADREEVIALAALIMERWGSYDDEGLGILSHTGSTPHNGVTPVVRRKQGQYQIDLILRNNRTDGQYPLGIFHPHPEHHHIKKENIGLIEAMGMAVLPGRLKQELADIRDCLLGIKHIEEIPSLAKHMSWFAYLKTLQYDAQGIQTMLERETAKKFAAVLEDAGVFKTGEAGTAGFMRFMDSLNR